MTALSFPPLLTMKLIHPNGSRQSNCGVLSIFVANVREEFIDKILEPRLELEELAGNPDGGRATAP